MIHLLESYLFDANTIYMFRIALNKKTGDIPPSFIKSASRNDHIEVLNWWRASGLEMYWTSAAINQASGNGHVAVLEWWKQSGLELKYRGNAIEYASRNGHVAVLEWWKQSGLENEKL